MTESSHRERALHEGVITALAVGGFLIIVGVVFGLTPGITGKIWDLFLDLTGVTYPAINGSIVLPAPAHPAAHFDLYSAVFNFMLAVGVLQIAILAARLWAHSPTRKIAETAGNAVFWLGGAVVANLYLLAGTLTGWFTFWPALIILAGASLIAQFFVYLVRRTKRHA
jgi:hypothetical protein